jgi:ribosomal protein S6
MAKKNEEIQEETLETGTETRVYELGFHLDPELPQEEVKAAYQAIRDRVSGAGTVVAEGEPVKVPLAYTISRMETTGRRDFNSAFFCWIAYEADGAGHEQVSAMAREDSRIIRFLDIRTTVDEAKHSAEMQEMFAQAASGLSEGESAETEEEAAPAAPAAQEADA